jgi:hypothetical protein
LESVENSSLIPAKLLSTIVHPSMKKFQNIIDYVEANDVSYYADIGQDD